MIELTNKKDMLLEDYTHYCSRVLLNLVENCLIAGGFIKFQIIHSDKEFFMIKNQEKGMDLRIYFDIAYHPEEHKIVSSISCEEDNLFQNGFYLTEEFSEKEFKENFDMDKYLKKADDIVEELTNLV